MCLPWATTWGCPYTLPPTADSNVEDECYGISKSHGIRIFDSKGCKLTLPYFLSVGIDAEFHRRAAGFMRADIRRGAGVMIIEIRNDHARVIPGA